MSKPEIVIRNDLFDRTVGLTRGRSVWVEVLWHLVKGAFFLTSLPWPSRLKRSLLIAFGAKVGRGLYIRPRVNIHFPWKLTIGEYCWIGESCEILNLEPIVLEDHVALSHESYLAAGSHDIRSARMTYKNRPIYIGGGTWVSTRAFIGPGVTIGRNCVIGACAVVLKDVPDFTIVGGNPAKVLGQRLVSEEL